MPSLISAVESGNHDLLRRLLAQSHCNVHETNARGWTALHKAALLGDVVSVTLLLQPSRIDPNIPLPTTQKTPLHLVLGSPCLSSPIQAEQEDALSCIDLLLGAHARVTAQCHPLRPPPLRTSPWALQPANIAFYVESEEREAQQRGWEITQSPTSRSPCRPLELAILSGNLPAMQRISTAMRVQASSIVPRRQHHQQHQQQEPLFSSTAYEALTFAITHLTSRHVTYLIHSCGSNVHATNAYGWTALHHAVVSGDLEMVRVVVGAGGDVRARTRGPNGLLPVDLVDIGFRGRGGGDDDEHRQMAYQLVHSMNGQEE